MLKKYAELLKQVRTEHEMNALGRGKDASNLISLLGNFQKAYNYIK